MAHRVLNSWICTLLACALLVVLPCGASAAINKQVNFQGRLTDAAGVVVADGTYNVEFKLHNTLATSGGAQGTCSGSCLWMETRTSGNRVTVSRGQFSVQLGEVTSLASFNFNQDPLYLSVRIGGTAAVPVWDGEMTPRRRLGSAPTAIYADAAGTAATATSATTAGSATTAATATNSTQLGGVAASTYAVKNANNSFTTSQNVTGGLYTTGDVSAGANLVASGNAWLYGGTIFLGNDGALYDNGTNVIRTDNSLQVGTNLSAGGSLTVYASAAIAGTLSAGTSSLYASTSTAGAVYSSTNWLRSPKNTVTAFFGDSDSTASYAVNDASADLRFNGSNTAWGDVGYYPNGGSGAGEFRFSKSGGSNFTTTPNAKVGVGSLYSAGDIACSACIDYTDTAGVPAASVFFAFNYTSGSWAVIGNWGEIFDNSTFWTAGTPGCVVPPVTGNYAVSVSTSWGTNGAGGRAAILTDNGSNIGNGVVENAQNTIFGGSSSYSFTEYYRFTAGHCISLNAYQNSGSTVFLTARLGITWLGP